MPLLCNGKLKTVYVTELHITFTPITVYVAENIGELEKL